MPPYRQLGSIPRKHHTLHPQVPGYKNEGIHYEEVITTAGFGRAYSIAYHLRPPTRVRSIEPAGTVAVELVDQPVLRHHHLKSGRMKPQGDPITGRVPLFVNADVSLALSARGRASRALSQCHRRRSAVYSQRGRHALDPVWRAALQAV